MDGPRPEQIPVLFRWFKEGPPGAIPIGHDHRSRGLLQAVTWEDAGSDDALGRLAAWHSQGSGVRSQGSGVSGARAWLVDALRASGRVLFWVKDVRGESVGVVGLDRLDADRGAVAISDVLCGDPAQQGLMAAAVECLADWVRQSLKLTVLRETERAAA